jgi:hypothetical protein
MNSSLNLRTLRLRRQLVLAIERGIAALDALDAESEDLEDGHDVEMDLADEEPDNLDLSPGTYGSDHDQTSPFLPCNGAPPEVRA